MISRSSSAAWLLLALALGSLLPRVALATPSADACTGMLQLDPDAEWTGVTIATPGVWCLDRDVLVDFAFDDIRLVRVDADHVTIDCRGYAMRVAPGVEDTITDSDAVWVETGRDAVVVRNCRFERFVASVTVNDSQDYLIEDNVVRDSRPDFSGVGRAIVAGGSGTIRSNRIYDAIGTVIDVRHGDALVADNLIAGITAGDDAGPAPVGIAAFGAGNVEIRGNTIRGMLSSHVYAITVGSLVGNEGRFTITGNTLVEDGLATVGTALSCFNAPSRYADNVISGFDPIAGSCADAGDNDISP